MPEPEFLPFALPDIGQEEIDAVVRVLRSRWLTTGAQAKQFETEFAAAVGSSHAVALNSCTAALHLSLEATGVGPGDLVFMSPYTFAASAEVVRYLNARPVFVDIDATTLNIDTTLLAEAVGSHMDGREGTPRAIMPVHIAGAPCELNPIRDLAQENGLIVVEDAAHAFPASYHGDPIGRVPPGVTGTVCFSFYATKTLTTGEGGMLTTEDAGIADRARSMSLHGLSRQAWNRYSKGGGWSYDIVAAGYKYNMTDIAAAMGRVQLARANDMLERRAEIARRYTEAFADYEELDCPVVPSDATSAWHLYVLRLRLDRLTFGRDEFIERLTAMGIGTSVHFIPLHLHSYYRVLYGYKPEDFPVATEQFHRALSLPIYSGLADADVDRVIMAVRNVAKAGGRAATTAGSAGT